MLLLQELIKFHLPIEVLIGIEVEDLLECKLAHCLQLEPVVVLHFVVGHYYLFVAGILFELLFGVLEQLLGDVALFSIIKAVLFEHVVIGVDGGLQVLLEGVVGVIFSQPGLLVLVIEVGVQLMVRICYQDEFFFSQEVFQRAHENIKGHKGVPLLLCVDLVFKSHKLAIRQVIRIFTNTVRCFTCHRRGILDGGLRKA